MNSIYIVVEYLSFVNTYSFPLLSHFHFHMCCIWFQTEVEQSRENSSENVKTESEGDTAKYIFLFLEIALVNNSL